VKKHYIDVLFIEYGLIEKAWIRHAKSKKKRRFVQTLLYPITGSIFAQREMAE